MGEIDGNDRNQRDAKTHEPGRACQQTEQQAKPIEQCPRNQQWSSDLRFRKAKLSQLALPRCRIGQLLRPMRQEDKSCDHAQQGLAQGHGPRLRLFDSYSHHSSKYARIGVAQLTGVFSAQNASRRL